MNIPDEYFTDDAPTQYGAYAIKHANGKTSVTSLEPGDDRKMWKLLNPGARFCRLAPAAEVERLKAENEKLREKLRGWVRDAYEEGYWDGHHRKSSDDAINASEALKRLDGRAEP